MLANALADEQGRTSHDTGLSFALPLDALGHPRHVHVDPQVQVRHPGSESLRAPRRTGTGTLASDTAANDCQAQAARVRGSPPSLPGNRGRDGIPIVDGQEPSWSMKSAAGIGWENIG